MKYILSEEEYASLTSKMRSENKIKELEDALSTARSLIISDEDCRDTGYCNECPIGDLMEDKYSQMNLICTMSKHFSK